MFSIIVALRVDHADRLINAEIVLNYLIQNIKDKEIILVENSFESYYERMNLTDRKDIIHIYQQNNDELFHRMKCINDGLTVAKFPISLIYDIDVLLPIKVFEELKTMILTQKYDIVKPFNNPPGCVYIHQSNKQDLLEKSTKGHSFDIGNYQMKTHDKVGFAGNGFVVCVNTETYKSLGGENEGFLAYGPEDNERYYRFQTLDKKVGFLDNPVYHLEHFRTNNSSRSNPLFNANEELFKYIRNMSKSELSKYYETENKFKV